MEYKENFFINRKNKISISQVNIKHFYNFYKDYIIQREFIYILENKKEIRIKFEKNNFPHLIGLHKIRSLKSKSANEIIEMIENDKIDITHLKHFFTNELKDRLTFYPCIHFLLNNVNQVIEFDPFKSIPTKLKADILINSTKIQVVLYLAVKKIRDNCITYVPTSIIVDRVGKYKGNIKQIISIRVEKIK